MEGECGQNVTLISFYQQISSILSEIDALKFFGPYFAACLYLVTRTGKRSV
jgi:hypothetical protein